MGFDPRHWRPAAASRPITTNVEALLAENDALRRQVRSLRLQLDLLLQQGQEEHNPASDPRSRPESRRRSTARSADPGPASNADGHGLSPLLVERWGTALATHPHWTELRIGPPGGLRALVEELRRRWWNPRLSLEEELNRHSPGLGETLAEALRGPHSRVRWVVRAAFALYGPRAIEWLNEEPLRVVEDLLQRLERLERLDRQQRRRQAGQRNPRGTRTANHSTAGAPGSAPSGSGNAGSERTGSRGGTTSEEVPGGDRRHSRRQDPDPGDRYSGARESGQDPGSSTGGGAGAAQGERQQTRRGQQAQGRSSGRGAGSQQAGASHDPGRRAADPRLEALLLLGLEPGAGAEAIKRAYRQLAKRHHPDLGGDAEAFLRLDAAYRLLL